MCLQGTRIRRTMAPLLRGVKKKKIFFKAIYTLTPSLGALGNVNLSSHYKMYLSVTKINSVILGGCCIHRDDSLLPPETAGFSHHF